MYHISSLVPFRGRKQSFHHISFSFQDRQPLTATGLRIMRKSPPSFSRDLTLTKVCHVMDVDIATDPVGTLQANVNFNAIAEYIEATTPRTH